MEKKPNKIHENLISMKIKQSYCTVLTLTKTQTYLTTGQQVPN